ncbi:MAG: hypothetical protein AB7T63_14260 [Planctomycetota bacterium]
MSTASGRRPRRASEAGFTFLEIVLVLTMTSMLAYLVERTFTTTSQADKHIAATQLATDKGQRLAYKLRELVSASRRLFGRDTVGADYLAALEIRRIPAAPDARLPIIDPLGDLVPDEIDQKLTGNSLFFVRESDPAEVVVDPVAGTVRYIDTYRFIYVYPADTPTVVTQKKPVTPARDLIVWRSETYPNYMQIIGLPTAAQRENAVKELVNRFHYQYAWDPSGNVGDSFYAMDTFGAISAVPEASFTILEDMNVSNVGSLVYAALQLCPSDITRQSYERRAWLTRDNDWWPHGFEVKIVGGSGSRKVWMRLTVEAPSVGAQTVVFASQLIASAHDL